MVSDTIFLEAIEFYGFHGASDEEQAIGHRYSVDVWMELDLKPACRSDRLAETVNYSEATRLILQTATEKRYRLLEALAEQLVVALMSRMPRLQGVRVRLRKVHPPMGAIAASAGVEIYRSRADYPALVNCPPQSEVI